MKRFPAWTMLSFVLSLAAAGCQTKPAANDGAGFEQLTPAPVTRAFIVAQDKPFARQVAAHNRTCGKLPACRK